MSTVDLRSEVFNPSSPEYGYTEIARDFFDSLGATPNYDELIAFRDEIRAVIIADIACITMSGLAGAISQEDEKIVRNKKIVPLYYGLDGDSRSGNKVSTIIDLNPEYVWRIKWMQISSYGTAVLRKEVLAGRERQ